VDPYYLTHKATSVGFHPELILAGRKTNDNMSSYIANRVAIELSKKEINLNGSKCLLLGLTFKENCPDIRNSKVIDIIRELQQFKIAVDVFDPHADKHEVNEEYGVDLIDSINKKYDAIVLAVSHKEFLDLDLKGLSKDSAMSIDSGRRRSLIDGVKISGAAPWMEAKHINLVPIIRASS
jgi:UDP-N-acetyl-D-galactosamine dehydrogenase